MLSVSRTQPAFSVRFMHEERKRYVPNAVRDIRRQRVRHPDPQLATAASSARVSYARLAIVPSSSRRVRAVPSRCENQLLERAIRGRACSLRNPCPTTLRTHLALTDDPSPDRVMSGSCERSPCTRVPEAPRSIVASSIGNTLDLRNLARLKVGEQVQ